MVNGMNNNTEDNDQSDSKNAMSNELVKNNYGTTSTETSAMTIAESVTTATERQNP